MTPVFNIWVDTSANRTGDELKEVLLDTATMTLLFKTPTGINEASELLWCI